MASHKLGIRALARTPSRGARGWLLPTGEPPAEEATSAGGPSAGGQSSSPGDHATLGQVHDAENLMRGAGVAMFVLGSSALLATLSLPDPDTSDHQAIRIIAALIGFGAVLMWLVRPGRRWLSHAAVVYGVLLVSGLMAVTRPLEATPFFYLWPMAFSAYFFSRREVAFDLLVMWVTLALALFVWSNDPSKLFMFVGVGASVTLTTMIVKLLGERLSAVIEQLMDAASTDYLTGLLNRRAFDEEFRRQIDRADRSDLPLSLAMFDLDRFKQINDRFGHPAGDRVLQDFAELLRRELRSGDTLARVGGEEFAVVLFGVGLDEAVSFAQRIGTQMAGLDELEAVPARDLAAVGASVRRREWAEGQAHTARQRKRNGRRQLAVTASAGVVSLSEDAPDPAAMLVLADRALYAAKDAGRRRVAVWSQGAIHVAGRMDRLDAVLAGAS
jgi:diguanylate cyclase (GGDEF)-like protein